MLAPSGILSFERGSVSPAFKYAPLLTGVQAISWTEITVVGQSAHAGTTPMAMRHDAAHAAAAITVGARDIVARIGPPMVGTVLYFHPEGAQGGGSMEVKFADGRIGWIGHVDNGLPAGTKVGPGTQLAVISSHHANPHVHWDLRA